MIETSNKTFSPTQSPELKTLEWWISGLRLNPLFFLISRINIAWKTHDFNLRLIIRRDI